MTRARHVISSLAPLAAAFGVALFAGCAGDGEEVGAAEEAVTPGQARAGKPLFDLPLSTTNGRACATCHTESEHTTLLPSSVVSRLAADPSDPLFNRLDADDPNAAVPTYEHLKKGLIRITLPLPDNMDLIDFEGHVVTPADRKISVWRGVPSVENVAYTAPYLFDGRASTLQQQALGALHDHSQIHSGVGNGELDLIAAYEQTIFSSDRARGVADQIAAGVAIADIPDPEAGMPLTEQEERGRVIYNKACTGCHGSATDNRIVNRAVNAQAFVQVDHDGNVVFVDIPNVGPVPVPNPHPNDEFLNIGFGLATYLGQIGQFPPLTTNDVEMPRYRVRFYTDGTRTTQVTDLPPIPVTASGDPFDPVPAINPATGAPIVGPAFAPQRWSTDPGRCLITGDPADFEAFDVPQLRGIAHTAPYMHDNSHATLRDVVDTYSRFIIPVIPSIGLPGVNPPEFPGLPPEALSPSQKDDLVAFLDKF